MSVLEKPWYLSALSTFFKVDVPMLMGFCPVSMNRDVVTLEERTAAEGESFLTKTLPQFGKSLDFALQERAPLAVSGFKKRGPRSALPAFLQALTRCVFEDDGCLSANPNPDAIRLLRQICYWCKKVEKEFTDESLQRAVSRFVDIDTALPRVSVSTDPGLLGMARAVVTLLIGRRFPKDFEYRPKHGPGAVAWGSEKYELKISYTWLERMFRPIPWFFSLRDASEDTRVVTSRWQTEYGLSRLAFVYKDSSGPRLIGLEPAEYMWVQQALKGWLYEHVEGHRLVGGQVNFTDQSINRNLARDWRHFDTLDMSDASDRNPLELVKILFEKTWILPWLLAGRTPGIVLPNGEALIYKKFAPMGSAVCFPVEAIVFYALAVASLTRAGVPFLLALKRTYVYGDDLIVPHGYFDSLSRDFEQFGLKFSDQKCCVSGKFRESCGLDAYDGIDVTPVRMRKPHFLSGDLDLLSFVGHRNALYERGYIAAAEEFWAKGLQYLSSLKRSTYWLRNLPSHTDSSLPIMTITNYDRPSTVRFHTKGSWRRYVTGYTFVQTKEELAAGLEPRILRCSLASEGPVGKLLTKETPKGNKVQIRVIDRKYAGSLVYKTIECPTADNLPRLVPRKIMDWLHHIGETKRYSGLYDLQSRVERWTLEGVS